MVKVLFIGGTGRTGSTTLDKVLGSSSNWFSGGELAFFWNKVMVQGGLCSCGKVVNDCEIWRASVDLAFKDKDIDSQEMVAQRKTFWSIHLPLLAFKRLTARKLDNLGDFPLNVETLYDAVSQVTHSRVIVDSSKESHYSFILRERTNLDIYFLHLVRDPRAVGYSWSKKKSELGFQNQSLMERRGVFKTTIYYWVSNLAGIWIWRKESDRYKILRYEDFANDPQLVMGLISDFVHEPIDLEQFSDGNTFKIKPSHLVWGNPNRFSNQDLLVAPDMDWVRRQSRSKSMILAAVNWPVARIFGYPLARNRMIRRTRFMQKHNLCKEAETL